MAYSEKELRAELLRRELAKRKSQSQKNKNQPLKDIFGKFLREQAKTGLSQAIGKGFQETPVEDIGKSVGYGAIPFAENLPQGVPEGFKGALGALIGKTTENKPVSDEYGAEFGRDVGRMIGQGIVAAPLSASIAGLGVRAGIPKLISQLGGTGLAFGATTPGDVLDRAISGLEASGIHGAGKLIGSIYKGNLPMPGLVKKIKSSLTIPEKAKIKNLTAEEREKALEKLMKRSEEFEESESSFNELMEKQAPEREEMIQDPLLSTDNPDILKRKENIAKQKRQEIEKELSTEPEMDLSQMPLKPIEEPFVDESRVPQHESLLKTKEQKAAQKEKEIKAYLGEGDEHGVPIAEWVVEQIEGKKQPGTKKRIGGLKREIGQQYDEIENNLKDLNIEIPRTDDIQKLEKEARKLLEQSRPFFKDDQEFENTLKKYMEATSKEVGRDIVPANEFLRNYRSIRQLSEKIRSKAFKTGITQDERASLLKQANEMKETADNMEHLLEQHDLGEQLGKLKEANKRWREEITPLYDNDVYQSFLNKGYATTKDLIYALRGNKEGQVIIRNLIKSNPEMLRRIVGMSHATNPESLLNPRELTREYLQHMPETRSHIDEYRSHLNEIEKAKQDLDYAKQVSKKEKELAVEQEKINKEEIKRRSKVSSLYDEMQKLKNDEQRLLNAYKRAKELSEQQKISLKEKVKLQKEAAKAKKEHLLAEKKYNKALKEYEDARKDLLKLGASAASTVGALFTGKKIKDWLMD